MHHILRLSRLRLLFAAAGLVLLSLTASASATTTVTISRPDGKPIVVAWPFPGKTRTVQPGARLRIKVQQAQRGSRPVEVRFVRLSGSSPTTLRRTRRTRGVVTVSVPKTPGQRYALRLIHNRRQVRSLVVTVAKPPAPLPSTAAPQPAPPSAPPPCPAAGALSAQLDILTPTVAPGDRIDYSVLNTGQVCFAGFSNERLERQEGNAWVAVWTPPQPTTTEPRRAAPGQRLPILGLLVPIDAPAGAYRLLGDIFSSETTDTQQASLQATFAVQP